MCARGFSEKVFQAEKVSNQRVEIEVLPRLGANLTSFKVDGQQLTYFDKEKLLAEDFYSGCFMMFPTPCRLTDSQYNFQGKHIRQT